MKHPPMVTPAHRDQHLNRLYKGKPKKRDRARRKAVNVASPSRQPSVLLSGEKGNATKATAVENDPFGVKAKLSRAPKIGDVRKCSCGRIRYHRDLEYEYMLEMFGLNDDIPVEQLSPERVLQLPTDEPENNTKHLGIEGLPDNLFEEAYSSHSRPRFPPPEPPKCPYELGLPAAPPIVQYGRRMDFCN